MARDNTNVQKIYLNELNEDVATGGRKASRIELRTLRDAYALKTEGTTISSSHETDAVQPDSLRRATAYCTAEGYNLNNLHEILKENPHVDQIKLYFGEGLYASYKVGNSLCDVFFLHYGVVVMWGLEESDEQWILKMVSKVEENSYDLKDIQSEKFKFGISKNSKIINDIIYITEDNNFHIKMVISIAVAQSVKLDYFEDLVDNTICSVKELPDEVEKEGKVGKRRQDILKIMGRLHKLNFNLYLVSNILAEPEFVWKYDSFSPLYVTCIRYLDIKTRADLLNKRCDIIQGILEILRENITTHNSEKLEKTMTRLMWCSVLFGALQTVSLLGLLIRFCWNMDK
ncbi:hypothetical protein ENBRE01_2218 [Enteropsectra breve]|nr:hypothetical protein ENBRE01_2218 [Enteropsectra breve]